MRMTKQELTTLHALFSLADEGCSATVRLVADRSGASKRRVARDVVRLVQLGLVRVAGSSLRLTFPGLAVAASVAVSPAAPTAPSLAA